MEDIEGRETASEMQESAQQTTPFNLENEFEPPPPLPETEDPPVDDPDQEPSPPSPEDAPPPPPPPDCAMGSDLPDDLDEDDPPLPAPLPDYNGEDPPPLDSEEEDPPPSDEEEGDPPPPSDEEEDDPNITLEHMKTNLQFVRMVEQATLASQFSPAELYLLRNPGQIQFCPSDDPDLRLSISLYISSLDHLGSQKMYTSTRENIKIRYPDSEVLSYDQVKRRVSGLSGVVTWKHDMCVDSCAAFTGPFADLEECPRCQKPRYDEDELAKSNGKKKVPQKVFTTFPLGPQLQSRWRSPEMAQKMFYRRNKTQDVLRARDQGEYFIYDDIFCGSDYLDAFENGEVNDYDTVVMLSMDGAQLYRNKKSDCWIYIWIILDLAPDQRYKIRNILPGGVIPGPKNPKHLDSFLFPGLAHLSAIQKEGLSIWDGYNRMDALSKILLFLILADAVGMAELSGSVGHHGKKGCRLLCGLFGRNKPGGPHYYPVLLRPEHSDAEGSNHPDFDINDLPPVDTDRYREDLDRVLSSPNETEYRR